MLIFMFKRLRTLAIIAIIILAFVLWKYIKKDVKSIVNKRPTASEIFDRVRK